MKRRSICRCTVRIGLVRALALTLGLMAGAVGAQEAGTDAAPEPPPIPVERTIPVPQIPERAELLQQTLRRYPETISPDPAVTRIEASLPQIREQSRTRVQASDTILELDPTLDQLGDLEREWTSTLSSLKNRREVLARRASSLEDELAELARLQELWSRSLESAEASQAPREVLEMVAANLAEIESVIERVRDRRVRVLGLLTSASEVEREAMAMLEKISRSRAVVRARLFEPDSVLLWTALASAEVSLAWSQIQSSIERDWTEIRTFVVSRPRAVVPIVLSFLVALVMARYVRDRLRSQAEVKRLVGSATVFERPVSVAFVIAVFAGVLVYPFASRLVRNFVGVLLVVPLIRLLRPITPEPTVRLFATLAVFYLVDRLRDLLAPVDLFGRVLFLGQMGAAATIFWMLLRPARLHALPEGMIPPAWLGGALRLGLVLFFVSALANVFGYVALSMLLGEGALGALYAGVVAYAAFRITTTLIVVVLSSPRVAWIRFLQARPEPLIRGFRRFFGLVFGVFWAFRTLEGFALREPVFDALSMVLLTPLEVGTVSISLVDVLAFPLTLVLAVFLSRSIRSVLEEDVYPRVTLARGVDNAVSTSIHYVLLVGGFFLALGVAGIDLGRFTLLAGAFGVGIGFGLQTVVNNFVSGLILLYERPIQVGDTIEVGGLLGDVKRIGIRASTILTFQGAEVIIPNGNLLSDQLINWTLSNKHRRVELPVGVAYGNRPKDVIEVLERVLEGEDRILGYPAPMVLFKGFGDSSLDFELRFWARDYSTFLVLASDVSSAVYDALARAGIEIPFPQRDLHLRSVDAGVAEKLRGGGRDGSGGGGGEAVDEASS